MVNNTIAYSSGVKNTGKSNLKIVLDPISNALLFAVDEFPNVASGKPPELFATGTLVFAVILAGESTTSEPGTTKEELGSPLIMGLICKVTGTLLPTAVVFLLKNNTILSKNKPDGY